VVSVLCDRYGPVKCGQLGEHKISILLCFNLLIPVSQKYEMLFFKKKKKGLMPSRRKYNSRLMTEIHVSKIVRLRFVILNVQVVLRQV
jgi:hypothetical protein